jgi:hypothetical protein
LNDRTARRAATLMLISTVLVAAAAPATDVGAAISQPPADRILPVGQYSTEKAKQLAARHDRALRELSTEIYHCLPWLEVKKEGIGFYKPKHMSKGDLRYLSLNVIVDQEPSAEFAKLSREDRASQMFSRYVAPLLRRMTRDQAMLRDGQLDGFTVIASWPTRPPLQQAGARPVNETIAVFVPRGLAEAFASRRLAVEQLARASHVLAWDGETAMGQLKVTAWEDNFLQTFQLAGYQVEKGVTCR